MCAILSAIFRVHTSCFCIYALPRRCSVSGHTAAARFSGYNEMLNVVTAQCMHVKSNKERRQNSDWATSKIHCSISKSYEGAPEWQEGKPPHGLNLAMSQLQQLLPQVLYCILNILRGLAAHTSRLGRYSPPSAAAPCSPRCRRARTRLRFPSCCCCCCPSAMPPPPARSSCCFAC